MEDRAERGNTGTGGVFAVPREALQPKLAAPKAAVPAALRASPLSMLHHVAMIMCDASSDYGESVEPARSGDTSAWSLVVGLIGELRDKAYPEVFPPSRPPLSMISVRSRYEQIRAIAEAVPA